MSRLKVLLIIVLVLIAVSFMFWALWIFPQQQAENYHEIFVSENLQLLEPKDRLPLLIQLEKHSADIENSNRLTFAQIIGGIVILGGLYFTYKNVRVAEEGKLTDRFSKAVELLGSEDLELRLGGIYALERIARDSKKDHLTVMEILTAFVRENSHKKLGEIVISKNRIQRYRKNKPKKEAKLREDIQAIMTVIGRRKWIKKQVFRKVVSAWTTLIEFYRLSLESIWGQRIWIKSEIDVSQNLNLGRVILTNCYLYKANLSKAYLYEADLSGANLIDANMGEARLDETNLSKTFLVGTNFSGASLRGANLSEASLIESDFSQADLREANLSKVRWAGANFSEAYLNEADLNEADLSGAIGLNLAQLFSTKNYETAKLPYKLELKLEEYRAKQSEKETEDSRDLEDSEDAED